jgi:acyl-coenzyme A thioesterase PaaI-like protein
VVTSLQNAALLQIALQLAAVRLTINLIRSDNMSFLKTWKQMSSKPGGKRIFSIAASLKAPYFATIFPLVEELAVGRGVVSFADRKTVHNHLGSVHAIAMCNSAELAAGLATDCSVPKGMRWIPKSMTVNYVKIAKGRMTATATVPKIEAGKAQDILTTVRVTNPEGVEVFNAQITMYVSAKS